MIKRKCIVNDLVNKNFKGQGYLRKGTQGDLRKKMKREHPS